MDTKTLATGLAAGLVGVAALVLVRDRLYALEPERVRQREERLREGARTTGLEKPVAAIATRAGIDLTPRARERIGTALAWTLGVLGALAYALARRRWPRASAAGGLAFGAAVWAIEDELLWPALGIARAPQAYPWQAHARGLAAHLAYGAATEAALRAFDGRDGLLNDHSKTIGHS